MNREQLLSIGILKFTFIQNTGGAFGIAQNSTSMFVMSNLIILGVIIRFMITQKDNIDKKTYISLILILSGGFSNLADRIFRGFVVDFIDINQIFWFPMFNIADICICTGCILFAISLILFVRNNNKKIEELKNGGTNERIYNEK